MWENPISIYDRNFNSLRKEYMYLTKKHPRKKKNPTINILNDEKLSGLR